MVWSLTETAGRVLEEYRCNPGPGHQRTFPADNRASAA